MRANFEIRMKVVITDCGKLGILVCVYANQNQNANFNCEIQMIVQRYFPVTQFSPILVLIPHVYGQKLLLTLEL